MPDNAHLTPKPTKSKSPKASKPVVTDNRPKRSAAMVQTIIGIGVPRALAAAFPLTPHTTTKRWCKKLPTPAGPKVFYFGALPDWQAALDRYNAEVEDLIAGRTPSTRNTDGLRLKDLLNRFLHAKRILVDSGELAMRSWYDYQQAAQRLTKVLGENLLVENLGPDHFEKLRADYSKTWKAVRIGGEINRVRIMFGYAFKNNLIDRPVRFGTSFDRPSRGTLRKARAKDRHEHGARMFTADELRKIIDAAPQPMRSMVLLGINGGLNNQDVATLTLTALDVDKGIIDFPRGKTGIPRIIPLWPETVASIKDWLAVRPKAKHEEGERLLFLTKQRRPWFRTGRFVEMDGATVVKGIDNPVSKSFRVLLDNLEIAGRRNFLALRHGFRTIGRGARDREAIDALMGHTDESMAGHYLEDGLPVERLRAVTEFVRAWLFAAKGGAA